MSSDNALPPNHEKFPDGSILRVVFHNFLIYDHTSFVPTANLNMILGHNGSGKSSIICGICLACGGSPKSLGRSDKIVEYVRHGCQEGYVEIALADKKKGPQTIRLTIKIGKAPEYRLNDEVTTQANLEKLRKHYNIQIDNPCAFLAQDKVKSFSEQSSEELLKNTEKAASETLFLRHEELAEQRKDSATIEEKCTTSEKALKHLETEIQNLEPFVENYRKKMALQAKLRLLEQKCKILEYEAAEKDYRNELKQMDAVMAGYRKAEEDVKDIDEKQKDWKKRVDAEREKIDRLLQHINANQTSFGKIFDKRRMEKDLENAKTTFKLKKEEAARHERELETAKGLLAATKERLAAAREELIGYDEAMKEGREMERKWEEVERECRHEEDSIQRKQYALNMLKRKAQMEHSASSQVLSDRLRAVHSISPDAAKAYQWYRANKNLFRGSVYVPLIDMVLKTPEAAKSLENSFAFRDLTMFVCKYKEDERLINGREQHWRINTSVVSQNQIDPYEIDGTLPPELKRLGFKRLVIETFDAPPELKQYLCNVAALNLIPIGDADIERNLAQVSKEMAATRYSVFLTNRLRCQTSKSRYSGEVIQTQTTLRDAQTWRADYFHKSAHNITDMGGISDEVKTQEAEIASLSSKLRESRMDLQKQRDVARKSIDMWRSKKQFEMRKKADLADIEARLRSFESKKIDVTKAEEEYKKAASAAKRNMAETFLKLVADQKTALKKAREFSARLTVETTGRYLVAKGIVEAETRRATLNQMRTTKENVEFVLHKSMSRKNAAAVGLEEKCRLKHLNEEKMTDREKRMLAQLNKKFAEEKVPTDERALDKEITTERTRLKMAEDAGQDGSVEHERRMEKLKGDLVDEQAKHDRLIENRTKVHEELGSDIQKWRDEVSGMIEKVNVNYVKYFGELGCRGEVSLEAPENPLDIEKYGIMIMVCFRAGEPMKRLDNKVQSGGERSVATMLYLLALQQLCPVPFRCIDEINQGMDPTNERKVFDIMVGLWNGSNGKLSKTQYFLLSPKLLHGLDMRENVNVVLVNSTLRDHHGKFFNTSAKLEATLRQLQLQNS